VPNYLKNERAAHENESNAKEPAGSGWEVVDGMDKVITSVAGLDVSSCHS
jgi:hypothetical protein